MSAFRKLRYNNLCWPVILDLMTFIQKAQSHWTAHDDLYTNKRVENIYLSIFWLHHRMCVPSLMPSSVHCTIPLRVGRGFCPDDFCRNHCEAILTRKRLISYSHDRLTVQTQNKIEILFNNSIRINGSKNALRRIQFQHVFLNQGGDNLILFLVP